MMNSIYHNISLIFSRNLKTLQNKVDAKNIFFNQVLPNINIFVFIIFLAYLTANLVSLSLLSKMIDEIFARSFRPSTSANQIENESTSKSASVDFSQLRGQLNYRDLRKKVLERNLFNRTGELAKEEEIKQDTQSAQGKFDLNAACSKPSTSLALVGTIYLGDSPNSVATFRDPSYSQVDIYKVGDQLIGHESSQIVKILRELVIVNNSGKKECYELSSVPESIKDRLGIIGDKSQSDSFAGGAENRCSNIELESSYVEKELGPGLANIIEKARIVPNVMEGRIAGFKIFGIDKNSLLGKLCLEENDIITRVNDVNLLENSAGDQGTALFLALQNEREVRLEILRSGQPRQAFIRIK